MGNCIGSGFALSHNDKKVGSDHEDKEIKVSAKEAGPVSELQLAAMLKSGEIYHIIPQQKQQQSLQGPPDMAKNGRVKIVVTKKQLQLLIKTAEQLQLGNVRFQSIRKMGKKKWIPSLATIPEL